MSNDLLLAGIDFGSQMAGTTVAAICNKGQIQLYRSTKGQSADDFLMALLPEQGVAEVWLDAPISLPGVYTGTGQDYFYRACDREAGAMSPMFLGGLTARAMRLKAMLEAQDIRVFETYPAAQARRLGWPQMGYKKDLQGLSALAKAWSQESGLSLTDAAMPVSWHDLDALLALLGGLRHQAGLAQGIGNQAEGLIWF